MTDVVQKLEASYEANLGPTVIPDCADAPEAGRRALGGISREGTLNLIGAAVGAVSLGLLLFGRLSPVAGPFGLVVVSYLMFLALYAFLTSVTEGRPVVVDKVMTVLMCTAGAVAGIALVSVISFVIWKGISVIPRTNLYTHDMSQAGPLSPLSVGGIAHAIVGTLIIITIAIAITVPLGLTCAVYLNESTGRGVRLVRTLVDAMTALPSILAGLFIFATWILILGFERSGLAAGLATGIMMLPIIIRSADVVLRLVPGNLREASAATGAPQWRTVWHVVLPTARSGLATAIILGVARGLGETAPVLLTAGFTASMNLNPVHNPMVTLPLAAFEFVRSPQKALIQRGFATAFVLMLVVLVLFAFARFLGGRPAGHLSKRQARRVANRSLRDAQRFRARPVEVN
ncbi:MAG: phosphate ABC transporter permease PstA [Actinobacteria bacterium]|nr:phosphate ABC transporter permease PstA [Actinomycetota bacterium]MBV8958286.1 phosphate ABC transporter permease PstA [Actinomycetota bacterium]MBV9253732.1 phosphate ABC transporter permease PstA [Actinomycetota bacterium]MBV9663123.1 phosphate ABC transporter permease PstA [Actinomycetota bacterium]MBV9933686.1 phosphate ABC transporter permease PstA [Actinomycetota bacterium]